MFSGARRTGLTVQRAICTCMGAGLAVRRILCTRSQLAWTCKESVPRSSCREIQSIDILVPKIWYHVPHPSNDQNMSQTTFFYYRNDVFWMGFGFKIWRCDISSLEPVPHKQIGSADTPIGPKFRSCQYHLARWLLQALIKRNLP